MESAHASLPPSLPLPDSVPLQSTTSPTRSPLDAFLSPSQAPPSPSPDATPTGKKTKAKATRTGAPNYSEDDIKALLDIVDELEPIGNNEWCLVSSRFNSYAAEHQRPMRDTESVKGKFDRLANTKKPTGDPSCPANVRRAKHIARNILALVNAVSVGDNSGEENNMDTSSSAEATADTETGSGIVKRSATGSVGARKRQRKAGAAGVSAGGEGEDMVEYMGEMARSGTKLVEVMCEPQGSVAPTDMTTTIRTVVQEEVKQELAHTNTSLEELKALILSSMSRNES